MEHRIVKIPNTFLRKLWTYLGWWLGSCEQAVDAVELSDIRVIAGPLHAALPSLTRLLLFFLFEMLLEVCQQDEKCLDNSCVFLEFVVKCFDLIICHEVVLEHL